MPNRCSCAGDEGGSVVLLERGLGMRVNAPPPRRHVGMEIGNAVDDRHGGDNTIFPPPLRGRVRVGGADDAMSP